MAADKYMKCCSCEKVVNATGNELYHPILQDMLSLNLDRIHRAQKNLIDPGYVQNNFNKVKCPYCGAENYSRDIKFLGFIESKKGVQVFFLLILLVVLFYAMFLV